MWSTAIRCLLISSLFIAAWSNAETEETKADIVRSLLGELSQIILADPGPEELPHGRGWRMCALAGAGTSLSPLYSGFGAESAGRLDIAKVLKNLRTYDTIFRVRNGIAWPSEILLYDQWARIVERAIPAVPDLRESLANDRSLRVAYKLLYRDTDEVDRARGTKYVMEPSDNYRKYIQFRDAERLLQASTAARKTIWKQHPLFETCASEDDARARLKEQWRLFGLKTEIEAGLQKFATRSGVPDWERWNHIQEEITWGVEDVDTHVRVPRTYVFPAPYMWDSLGDWRRVRIVSGIEQGHVEFEYTLVDVMRPWFDPDSLFNGALHVSGQRGEISNGAAPSYDHTPEGTLPCYVEQLIIIRRVRSTGKSTIGNHPLLSIASPDSITLLGFVLRVLPELPHTL